MTVDTLALLIVACGIAQYGVLVASALVPLRLNWRGQRRSLSRLLYAAAALGIAS